jgi:hypothetical protein
VPSQLENRFSKWSARSVAEKTGKNERDTTCFDQCPFFSLFVTNRPKQKKQNGNGKMS